MQIINLLDEHLGHFFGPYGFDEDFIFKWTRCNEPKNINYDHRASEFRYLLFQEIIHNMYRLWGKWEPYYSIAPCPLKYHPEVNPEKNSIENSLMHLMEQIPVFFVDENSIGKSFKIGFLGKSLEIIVPEDKYKEEEIIIEDLLEEVEDGICEEVDCEKELFPKPDFPERKYDRAGEPMDTYVVNDLLGVYVRTYPANRVYDMTESHPQIFIWIDKIWKISKKESGKTDSEQYDNFMALLAQVITHEFMHAFMDIDLLGSDRIQRININPKLYNLREESLANALSLCLIKPHLNVEQWYLLRKFVKSQPYAYRLGLRYEECDYEIVIHAFQSWMEIKLKTKKHEKVNEDLLKYWLEFLPHWGLGNYSKEQQMFDSEMNQQMCLYEEAFVHPEWVLRYQSKMYPCRDLAVKVIKDYYANKMIQGGVSRQDMKDAFPDNLNSECNVFIDYPEFTRFRRKDIDYSWSVDEKDNIIIACIDGRLAISYLGWKCSDMHSFVENAKKLGFDIETFDN